MPVPKMPKWWCFVGDDKLDSAPYQKKVAALRNRAEAAKNALPEGERLYVSLASGLWQGRGCLISDPKRRSRVYAIAALFGATVRREMPPWGNHIRLVITPAAKKSRRDR